MVVLEWILYIVGGGITAYYSFRHSWWLFPKKISRWKRSRMSDYDFYTDRTWGAATTYDICIDSSVLGIERTAELLRHYVEQRIAIATAAAR